MSDSILCLRKDGFCVADQVAPTTNSKNSWLAQLKERLQEKAQRWYQNWRTRQQLAELDRFQLQDIGVSRSDALEEASKPFWKS